MPIEAENDVVENQAPVSYEDDLMADIRAAATSVAEGQGEGDAGQETPPDAPSDKPATGDRSRDERGRFAKSEPEAPKPAGTVADPNAPAAPTTTQQAAPAEQQQASGGPPPGWSVQSKAAWDALPPHIKADIAKREQEISAGFQQYAGLKPYAEMARQNNKQLPQVLESYVNMENILRSNPANGLMTLAQNLGWSQQQAAQHFLALAQQLGANVGQAAPKQQAVAVDPNDPFAEMVSPVVQQALAPILNELNGLKSTFGGIQSTFQQRQEAEQNAKIAAAEKVVAEFQADPKYRFYPNLQDQISQALQAGMVQRSGDLRKDLEAAYEFVAWGHPEVRAELIKGQQAEAEAKRREAEKAAAQKARHASRSISGAPPANAVTTQTSRRAVNGASYDDDLMADIRAAANGAGA